MSNPAFPPLSRPPAEVRLFERSPGRDVRALLKTMLPSDDRLKDRCVAAFVSSMQMRGFRLEDYGRELQHLQERSAGMTPEQFNVELDGISFRVSIGFARDDAGSWPESPAAD